MSDENKELSQEEIEKLLQQAQAQKKSASAEQPSSAQPEAEKPQAQSPEQVPDADKVLAQEEIEQLLAQAKSGQGSSSPATSAAAGSAQEEDDSSEVLSQEAIEQLLAKARGNQPPVARKSQAKSPQAEPEPQPSVHPQDVEYLLRQAEEALHSLEEPAESGLDGLKPFELKPLGPAPPSSQSATLSLLRDVELEVRIELGRTHLPLEEVLKLGKGSVVPLNKLAGDPVDIYVNGRPVARGEVLVLNDNFCIRVAELIVGDAASESQDET